MACAWSRERMMENQAENEFVHCIAQAAQEKCAVILTRADFFSILSDGSQAHKTKAKKELVLICTERNGIPIYIVASLLKMEKFSGGNADAIVKGIKSVFEKPVPFAMSPEPFQGKLISCITN